MSGVIEVSGLCKSFGGVVANRDLTLGVEAGSITGLIGPNGSGKTTLFNCIVGSDAPDRGQVLYCGESILGRSVQHVARLGLLRTFQQTRVFGSMSCRDNMRVSVAQRRQSLLSLAGGYPAEVDERALELLEFVGLYALRQEPAGELSFGQQKLLEFAMALMSEPQALLLDEPTAGINPTMINAMIERLRRANEELGITLFVIEHNMRVIMSLASHIYCLANGALLAGGTPAEIQADPRVVNAYLGAR